MYFLEWWRCFISDVNKQTTHSLSRETANWVKRLKPELLMIFLSKLERLGFLPGDFTIKEVVYAFGRPIPSSFQWSSLFTVHTLSLEYSTIAKTLVNLTNLGITDNSICTVNLWTEDNLANLVLKTWCGMKKRLRRVLAFIEPSAL